MENEQGEICFQAGGGCPASARLTNESWSVLLSDPGRVVKGDETTFPRFVLLWHLNAPSACLPMRSSRCTFASFVIAYAYSVVPMDVWYILPSNPTCIDIAFMSEPSEPDNAHWRRSGHVIPRQGQQQQRWG
jgi:hypothetical protein